VGVFLNTVYNSDHVICSRDWRLCKHFALCVFCGRCMTLLIVVGDWLVRFYCRDAMTFVVFTWIVTVI